MKKGWFKSFLTGPYAILSLIICYLLFLSFYSFWPLDESDLITVETKIVDATVDSSSGSKTWVTFRSDDGEMFFYVHNHTMQDMSPTEFVQAVRKEHLGQTATVAYTNRKNITPTLLSVARRK